MHGAVAGRAGDRTKRRVRCVGFNIFDHPIDEVRNEPRWKAARDASINLCERCRNCKFMGACGGGYLPHRFSRKNGYDNPSVYCDDLYAMFETMQAADGAGLAAPQIGVDLQLVIFGFTHNERYPDAPPGVGSVAKVVDDIARMAELGVEHLELAMPPGPTTESILEQMHRFADDVVSCVVTGQ